MEDTAGVRASEFEFLPDPDQLDLLRDPKTGKLPNDALRQIRMRKGPGRPSGARNKANQKVANWFITKYGHPLAALGEIIITPEDILYEQMVLIQGGEAKNKRITGRDAKEFRLKAILEALPYIVGKQPISVEVTNRIDKILFMDGVNKPSGFTSDQLTTAVEVLGAAAIELDGIRLLDGRLIQNPDELGEVIEG